MSLTPSCLADLMGASGWSGAGQATNGVQSYCRPAGGAVPLMAVPFFPVLKSMTQREMILKSLIWKKTMLLL